MARKITIVFDEDLGPEEYAARRSGIWDVLKIAHPGGGFHLESDFATPNGFSDSNELKREADLHVVAAPLVNEVHVLVIDEEHALQVRLRGALRVAAVRRRLIICQELNQGIERTVRTALPLDHP